MRRLVVMLTAAGLFLIGGIVMSIVTAWMLAAHGPFLPRAGAWDEYTALEREPWIDANLEWWIEECPFHLLSTPENTVPVAARTSSKPESSARIMPAANGSLRVIKTSGLDVRSGSATESGSSVTISVGVKRIRAGLPFRCLSASDWSMRTIVLSKFERTESQLMGGIPLDVSRDSDQWQSLTYFIGPRMLPLRPIWPGFIANTLFFALLLWLLFFAPFALRRLIRQRRGLCERCAYPIGESPVCTECGAAIARWQAA